MCVQMQHYSTLDICNVCKNEGLQLQFIFYLQIIATYQFIMMHISESLLPDCQSDALLGYSLLLVQCIFQQT